MAGQAGKLGLAWMDVLLPIEKSEKEKPQKCAEAAEETKPAWCPGRSGPVADVEQARSREGVYAPQGRRTSGGSIHILWFFSLDAAVLRVPHGAMGDAPVRPGDVLAGKYRVERVLGQGNMGIVVAATHLTLGQLVALKFLLASRKQVGPEQLERFLREGRAAARLKSTHVTRVFDVGTLDDGAPYTVMEYLEGRDLKAILVEGGPLPIVDAVEYVLQACEAIGEAHAAGVVHRDIKPANLFLTTDVSRMPCVKVCDFGVSKLGGDLTLTQDAVAMGTPLYMSPEQLNSSRDVDGRADLWSLGASLFELLGGQTPFHADTMQQLCYRLCSGHPTPLSQLRPDVPARLEAVIMRCLERDRTRRFNNSAELAAELAPWAPARAAAYPERVARVLNVQLKPARTAAMLSEPRHAPLPAPLQSNAAGAPPPSTGGTMLLPVRSAMASSPVASTQDTALTRSNPQDSRMGGSSAARVAGERAPVRLSRSVVTVGAVGVVALALILGVKLRYSPTYGDSATTARLSPSPEAPGVINVPAPPELLKATTSPSTMPLQPSIPIDEAIGAPSGSVASPMISASGPPALNAAHTPRPKPSPSSHGPVRANPLPVSSPGDTIE